MLYLFTCYFFLISCITFLRGLYFPSFPPYLHQRDANHMVIKSSVRTIERSTSSAITIHNTSSEFQFTDRGDTEIKISISTLKQVHEILKETKPLAFHSTKSNLLSRTINFIDEQISSLYIPTLKESMYMVNIIKLAGDYELAIKVFSSLKYKGSVIDTQLCNNIIDVCVKYSSNISHCRWILDKMTDMNIIRDVKTYGTIINKLCDDGRMDEVNEFLSIMKLDGIHPDIICYTSIIKAYIHQNLSHEVINILEMVESMNLQVDAYFYNAAIKSCSEDQFVLAMQIFHHLLSHKSLKPDSYTYATVMTLLDKQNKTMEVLQMTSTLLEQEYITNSNMAATIPYNIAFSCLVRNNSVNAIENIYYGMLKKKILPNSITYTTLITGLIKHHQYEFILRLFNDMLMYHIPCNVAIYGAAAMSAEKLGYAKICLHLIDIMKKDGTPISTGIFNSVIGAVSNSKVYDFDKVKILFNEMKNLKVPRSATTYNLLINACKRENRWMFAVKYLNDMKKDRNEGIIELCQNSDVINPTTVTYSTVINVCVESKQWGLALELLDEMESRNVSRNIVTYNSIIEALDYANETVRAELVYQSALRMNIYQHWLLEDSTSAVRVNRNNSNNSNDNQEEAIYMDLHKFPLAVAKVAIMHVISEFCAKKEVPATPLVIITGRGNHIHSSGKRGILKKELEKFLSNLGISVNKEDSPTSYRSLSNPGRIVLTKEMLESWIQLQYDDDKSKREKGISVHGNLFLQVAFAKHLKDIPMDVKATCPFSTATLPAPQVPIEKT